ncbi:MAG: hypothetical protein KGJ86_00450 [Chloroflexota bacterium]|nr:hypothetical protein [Chloroflexota bacterium]
MHRYLLLVLLLAVVSCSAAPQGGRASHWSGPVGQIETTFNQAVAAYQKDDRETATRLAQDAYFDIFESSGMETAIRQDISARRASELEFAFGKVRQRIRTGAQPSDVRQSVSEVMALLREDAARLPGSG